VFFGQKIVATPPIGVNAEPEGSERFLAQTTVAILLVNIRHEFEQQRLSVICVTRSQMIDQLSHSSEVGQIVCVENVINSPTKGTHIISLRHVPARRK
jgi:hypothetical protein